MFSILPQSFFQFWMWKRFLLLFLIAMLMTKLGVGGQAWGQQGVVIVYFLSNNVMLGKLREPDNLANVLEDL